MFSVKPSGLAPRGDYGGKLTLLVVEIKLSEVLCVARLQRFKISPHPLFKLSSLTREIHVGASQNLILVGEFFLFSHSNL